MLDPQTPTTFDNAAVRLRTAGMAKFEAVNADKNHDGWFQIAACFGNQAWGSCAGGQHYAGPLTRLSKKVGKLGPTSENGVARRSHQRRPHQARIWRASLRARTERERARGASCASPVEAAHARAPRSSGRRSAAGHAKDDG